jgi:hypothetical protein
MTNPPDVSLYEAAFQGNIDAVKQHIKAGSDLNARNNEGSTALHTAAFLCRMEIVKVLLDKGADKNVKNNAGSTALDSVAAPFDDVKGIYDYLGAAVLRPLGFELDYERIKMMRPKVAEMLR